MGRSDGGVVVNETVAGWWRMVVLGPSGSGPALSERFLEHARAVVREQLHAALPGADPVAHCERLLLDIDRALRIRIHPDSEERATMVVAMSRRGQLWIGDSGGGSAKLRRGDTTTWLEEATGDYSSGALGEAAPVDGTAPWLGAKQGENTLQVRVRARALELEVGDRLLLASSPRADVERLDALRTMLARRSVEDAAHELGCALAAQQATPELALAIAEWTRPSATDDGNPVPPEDQISSDLGDLADLIRDVIDEYDTGVTPRTSDRAETRLGHDAEEPAETVYNLDDAEPEAPVRRVVKRPSVPSQPTLDVAPDTHTIRVSPRRVPSPPRRIGPLWTVTAVAAIVVFAAVVAYLLS